MLLNILLVILVLDCIALSGVILLQRSEGGALGMGGGPSGLFTARGAGDLLSRTTAVLAAVFFILSFGITLLAGHSRSSSSVTERLKVNPIDLNAIARPQASGAPAASSAEAAPPLPGAAAPPLPTAPTPRVAAAPLPTQAPRPTLRAQPRPQAANPVTAPNSGLADIAVTPSSRTRVPRPDVNAAPAGPPSTPAPAANP